MFQHNHAEEEKKNIDWCGRQGASEVRRKRRECEEVKQEGGLVADFLPAGKKEPKGSTGSSQARPTSRKALTTVIHYSATSTISLCWAIFTCCDKIDSMYKRMRNIPPLPPLLTLLHITTYLFIWHFNAPEWYRCSFYPFTYSSGLWKSLFRAV